MNKHTISAQQSGSVRRSRESSSDSSILSTNSPLDNIISNVRSKWHTPASYDPINTHTESSFTTNEDVDLSPFQADSNRFNPRSRSGVNLNSGCNMSSRMNYLFKSASILRKFVKYIGPGLMVSVAYMDPGNFSSSIASAQFQYKLLFSLVVSNIMAGFLQVLASKLGICTGEDLAANCKKHLPPTLNYIIYIFAEISVVATDVAEIIGTAIAFNIIFNIPLLVGVLLSILDMLFVIMAYRPDGPMVLLRVFEGFVSLLVFGTVICFAIELAKVSPTTEWKEVALGFFPSKAVFTDIKGLYLSAALLGSNLMPHSLYLGSGVVQARMKAFDIKMGHYVPNLKKKARNLFTFTTVEEGDEDIEDDSNNYKPSIHAIDETMTYTIAELVVSLIFVALFVNAAILIVAGSALSNPTDDDGDGALENADLFTLHHLLTSHLSKAAGSVFAFALLCSGLCGGTVVTIAGQMIMEGHSNAKLPPGIKRMITRALALLPCILVVLAQGREGLSAVLNASQVVLSFMLPFICAPLIYLTSNRDIMKVEIFKERSFSPKSENFEFIELDAFSDIKTGEVTKSDNLNDMNSADRNSMDVGSSGSFDEAQRIPDDADAVDESMRQYKYMNNSTLTTIAAVIVWLLITFLNFWLLISMALGKDVPV